MNILFTCAGRRNYLINYFKEAINGNGIIFAADMQLSAPALIDADVALQVPPIYSEDYVVTILNLIKEYKINCIISLNDLELPILSKAKSDIESLGAKLIVSDEHIINTAFDKWKTVKFLNDINIKSPITFIDLEKAKMAINNGDLKFPIVLKPRWGSASIGIEFTENLDELELAYKLLLLKIKRSILSEASMQDIDHAILIQEKLKGTEYGVDILNDFSGNYVDTFVRKKLQMRAGETDKAISVIDERFNNVGKIIGNNLKHIGNLDCDIFEYKNELYVLEINPRFGGGYPFSHEAGSNTAAVYIEWLKGNTDVKSLSNYKEGIMFSKCDRLLKVN
ncbi:ATP-grasp domain-containing protein [Sphingobacterium sp. SGL-16]|uniref:ATP-grasp domain-containing protein n=1 Tax=Sphingobacterium sp. SGL-16 TaxID=2710883 RepID=UPI0013ED062B|nr:ATP-grasp domain-containing protein [Sphingobacterium sp. SGL-16]NGM73064.1 ATP-grasp domain-containing protein [Sphingobacterium sp. SGL-16]